MTYVRTYAVPYIRSTVQLVRTQYRFTALASGSNFIIPLGNGTNPVAKGRFLYMHGLASILPVALCLLPIACCLVPVAYCLWPLHVADCLLPMVHRLT